MRLATLISAIGPLEVRGSTSGEIAALSYDAAASQRAGCARRRPCALDRGGQQHDRFG